MIVVIDTNVIVSALLHARGTPGRLLELVAKNKITLAISPSLLDELQRVLTYPKIRKLLLRTLSESQIQQFVDDLTELADMVPDQVPEKNWLSADPDDNWVIQCAVTAEADRIVSGDRRLLELEEVERIPIVTAAQLVEELE